MKNENEKEQNTDQPCGVTDQPALLNGRPLTIVSNRGPIGFSCSEEGELQIQRSSGGLVTALLGLAQNINVTWIASAINDLENEYGHGQYSLNENGRAINLELVPLEPDVYEGFYNVISNPLLWFLQHSMWDVVNSPTITRATWQAWQNGYVVANQRFAEAVAHNVRSTPGRSIVMVQDYHLYLLPRMLRKILHLNRKNDQLSLTHFVHIPWPGAEELRILPPEMRLSILEGMTAVDVLGFQTYEDSINFLQAVIANLPGASVSYKNRRIWYRNRATIVRDFPISIDVAALKERALTEEVKQQREALEQSTQEMQVILRVDRTEPSKNIVRGFEALAEMLETYPEHIGKVKFIALLVPSRLDVDVYRDYHDKLMAAAGWVNSKFGTSDWEPIRIILGDNYDRAIAGLQLYDVLLVNSIADGMNLVAKEGPIDNQKNGVLVLSERTGVSQQLSEGALTISPCDIVDTANALHQALVMPEEDRARRARILRTQVEQNDINAWFCDQINEITRLGY